MGRLRRVINQISDPSKKMWEDAEFLLVEVPVDKNAVKRILPSGVFPSEPPRATFFIANYPKTSFTGSYRESAVLIHVKTLFGRGLHCPWMIVDDDTALIYGRELLGFPKKMGKFEFVRDGNTVYASISRRGVKVLEIKGVIKEKEEKPEPVLGRKIFNASGLGQFFLINPVWVIRPIETIKESYSADFELTVTESESDPLYEMKPGKPVKGRYVKVDILGAKYVLPVFFTGLRHFSNTHRLRFV